MFPIRVACLLLCLGLCQCIHDHKMDPDRDDGLDLSGNKNMLKRGRGTLKEYEQKGSPCWSNVVLQLKQTCAEMNDIEQSILAMKFANCHLEKSDINTHGCTNKETFKACTNLMKKEDPTSFLVYTEFFTHVTDICYYLQSDLWRKRTEQTILKLSSATEETVDKLQISLSNQNMVLHGQNKSLLNQQEIMKQEQKLQNTLQNSTASAKAAFEKMKQRADEQKQIFSSTFDGIFAAVDKLTHLQSMLLGEFLGLQSLLFYIGTIFACYFLTSAPQTSRARMLLFVAFVLLFFVERFIVDKSLQGESVYHATSVSISWCEIKLGEAPI